MAVHHARGGGEGSNGIRESGLVEEGLVGVVGLGFGGDWPVYLLAEWR